MARSTGNILTETVIVGVGAVIIGSGVAYTILGKKYFEGHVIRSVSILFLTGALVHVASELVGGNKVFCENFMKQTTK